MTDRPTTFLLPLLTWSNLISRAERDRTPDLRRHKDRTMSSPQHLLLRMTSPADSFLPGVLLCATVRNPCRRNLTLKEQGTRTGTRRRTLLRTDTSPHRTDDHNLRELLPTLRVVATPRGTGNGQGGPPSTTTMRIPTICTTCMVLDPAGRMDAAISNVTLRRRMTMAVTTMEGLLMRATLR